MPDVDVVGEVGRGFYHLLDGLNPERVVIGGQLSLAADLLLDPLRDSFRRYAVQAAAESVEGKRDPI